MDRHVAAYVKTVACWRNETVIRAMVVLVNVLPLMFVLAIPWFGPTRRNEGEEVERLSSIAKQLSQRIQSVRLEGKSSWCSCW